MATCKECIHERVCFALIKTGLPYVDDKHPAEAFCMAFKSTADVAEVKHGEWVQRLRPYEDEIHCTVCEAVFNVIDNCTEKFDYCPNCGAKMDGGKKGK